MNRRRVLISGLATMSLVGPFSVSAQSVRRPTPSSAEGPFYPDVLPLDRDNDLVSVSGRPELATGTIFHLGGILSDRSGAPLAGARIEIWQCDSNGVYLHSADSGRNRFDPGFQGFGSTVSAENGAYRFRTILPVPYAGRTPHIHFRVIAPNRRELTTQMYLAGHPGNARDFLFRRLAAQDMETYASTEARPASGVEKGAVTGRFDIVLV